MNFRNKKLVIAVRVILGLFFLMSGVGGLMGGGQTGIPAPMLAVMQTLMATGIFYMIKITEVIAGLLLVTGFLPQLGAIALVPVCVGVIVFNARISPEYLPAGIFVSVLTAYLGYAWWDTYKVLFTRK